MMIATNRRDRRSSEFEIHRPCGFGFYLLLGSPFSGEKDGLFRDELKNFVCESQFNSESHRLDGFDCGV
jgi:hypothetical protein